jgi:hypothetical protein
MKLTVRENGSVKAAPHQLTLTGSLGSLLTASLPTSLDIKEGDTLASLIADAVQLEPYILNVTANQDTSVYY